MPTALIQSPRCKPRKTLSQINHFLIVLTRIVLTTSFHLLLVSVARPMSLSSVSSFFKASQSDAAYDIGNNGNAPDNKQRIAILSRYYVGNAEKV